MVHSLTLFIFWQWRNSFLPFFSTCIKLHANSTRSIPSLFPFSTFSMYPAFIWFCNHLDKDSCTFGSFFSSPLISMSFGCITFPSLSVLNGIENSATSRGTCSISFSDVANIPLYSINSFLNSGISGKFLNCDKNSSLVISFIDLDSFIFSILSYFCVNLSFSKYSGFSFEFSFTSSISYKW